ncbi:MAG: hypothetical protein HY231_06655 [Acidobacteria bacterium]|nr:hypothetical protein [Acidobacteriota bacterium]
MPILGVSVSEAEQTKLLELLARIRVRTTAVEMSQVLRELLGFDPLKVVTPEDLAALSLAQPVVTATTHTNNELPNELAETANLYEITKKLQAEGYEIEFQTVVEVLLLDAPGVAPEIRERIVFEAGRLLKPADPTAAQEGKTPESQR